MYNSQVFFLFTVSCLYLRFEVYIYFTLYGSMERLDQGHLHPKLVVPELTCPGNRTRASRVGGEHSRKEPSGRLVDSYSEHLHMSPRQ
jgi:hypothetical protein